MSMQNFRRLASYLSRSWLGGLLLPIMRALTSKGKRQEQLSRALQTENVALKAQLANVGLELLDARDHHDVTAIRTENDALKAQLANVGLELLDARDHH